MRYVIQAPPFTPLRGFPWPPTMPPGPPAAPSTPQSQGLPAVPVTQGQGLPATLQGLGATFPMMPVSATWVPQGAAPPPGMPQSPGGWPVMMGPAAPAQSVPGQGWAVGTEELR